MGKGLAAKSGRAHAPGLRCLELRHCVGERCSGQHQGCSTDC